MKKQSELILDQQEIAEELLSKLKYIDGKMILAGGSVSDWSRGSLARDLDFYMQMPSVYSSLYKANQFIQTVVEPVLGLSLKYKGKRDTSVSDSEYANISGIKAVYEGVYREVPFEIILCTQDDIWKEFDASICKAYVKPWDNYSRKKGFDFTITPECKTAIESKIILIGDQYRTEKRSEIRFKKLRNKYPDYALIQSGIVYPPTKEEILND